MPLYCIGGTDDNNIFTAGQKVIHFNGQDWHVFDELSNKYGNAKEIQCVKDRVYILFTDNYKSFVVKGILKK